jgi:CRISPR-associated exonuclease Cas4
MYNEDDLLPISALEHLMFCERQAALIHIEQQWSENRFTAEGHALHDRAHNPATETRGDIRIARSLRLRSLALGLSGQADVVEFHRLPVTGGGLCLPDVKGRWAVFPVEYKRGHQRPEIAFAVQLCAQAICLEEMLHTTLTGGALFYGKSQHRQEIAFDLPLRQQTIDAAVRLHELIDSARTPPALANARCSACSLADVCLPAAPNNKVDTYLTTAASPDTLP